MTFPAAVVFDLDGTLIDSIPDVCAAVNVMLEDHGRPPLSLDTLRGMVGHGAGAMLDKAFEATGGGPTPDGALARYLGAYRAHPTDNTRIYDGAVELLDILSAAGVVLGICTNKPGEMTRLVLDGLGLHERFAAVVCGDETPYPKPDGRHVTATLAAMGLMEADGGAAPLRAVFVGDALPDVQAARAAGLSSVVVTFGYDGVAAMRFGADAVIDHFSQLPPLLEHLA